MRVSDAHKRLGFAFKTSSHSGGGECVEVALSLDGGAIVRDTKDPDRRVRLLFSARAWSEFVQDIKNGRFDTLSD
jgi:hypothetical protein